MAKEDKGARRDSKGGPRPQKKADDAGAAGKEPAAAAEKSAGAKATAEKAPEKKAAAEPKVAQPLARAAGAHPAEAPAAAHGHHAPNRREYFVIFGVLAALTALEVGVAKVPGISRSLIGLALVSLAVTKAAIVGLYYMHLKSETRVLRLTVAIPMATPAVYALVLIAEAAWRLNRW